MGLAGVNSQNVTIRTPPKKCCKIHSSEKVKKVALWIFFSLISAALLLYQTPIFILGLITGVVLKDTIRSMIDKIQGIWKRQPWQTVGVGLLATLFAFPVVVMAGAFLTSGYIGVRFEEWRQKGTTS